MFYDSSEVWEKVNVSWYRNGDEVEYSQKKTFFFSPEKSVGAESDILTLPNVPMIVSDSNNAFVLLAMEFRYSNHIETVYLFSNTIVFHFRVPYTR